MNAAQLIVRKRDGHALTRDELAFLIRGFTDGTIPDYQMAAMAMAIYLNGMDTEETALLTEQMLHSGQVLKWPADHVCVDKHSTGGVGDKVSLVLAPLVACCGLHVPMISGRGLGPTGGTLDKLEAIPGFRTQLPTREMQALVKQVGCAMNGATAELAPADKKLYALRDVTGTVPSIPLITASILSKKLAEGLQALVLDVKCGGGAFMKTLDRARQLADSLSRTGERLGLKTKALLTDMHQPLGRMVGHALEVNESIDALVGAGPPDLHEVTVRLAAELMMMTGKSASLQQAVSTVETELQSGRAMEKFAEMVAAQGGDLGARRPVAAASEVLADRSGFVHRMDNEALGWTLIELGGGRRVKTDQIDHSVGFEMLVRVGDAVQHGQPLVRVFAHRAQAESAEHMISAAVIVDDQPPAALPLFLD